MQQCANPHEGVRQNSAEELLKQTTECARAQPLHGLIGDCQIFARKGEFVRNRIIAAVKAAFHVNIIPMNEVNPQVGLSWQAPEFEQVERSSNWYLWSIGIAIALVILAFLQSNLMFALFIVIAEIMLLTIGKNKPQVRVFSLTEEGIFEEDRLLKVFSELNGFAFFDLGGRYVELVLRPAKKLKTYTKVLVPHERAEDIQQFLSTKLHPFEYEGSFSDALVKRLGL